MADPTPKTCSKPDCFHKKLARGLCANHYAVARRAGTLPPRLTTEQRFWSRVDKSGACWVFVSDVEGYGTISVPEVGRTLKAHRYSWELVNGPIPEDLQLDHKCHNKACIRPSHLRLTTSKQNNEHQSGARRHSKTGVRGVWVDKGTGRFHAKVCHNYIPYFVGSFRTLKDAEAAVINKRNELFTHNDLDRNAA